MRHLMISAVYALAFLASCILAVGNKPNVSTKQKVYEEKAEANEIRDNASQTLTTYYSEPTGISKDL
ncbi:MAG: hypothetical protein KJN76_13665 [Eudoraea sp.]|nr:hypothetical protein [Eudoraea sp.]